MAVSDRPCVARSFIDLVALRSCINALVPLRDLVVHFVLDPALWRDLDRGDAIEQIVVDIANWFWGRPVRLL
jgi:hypothetical protein